MKKQKFDERQLMARGKAYGAGCMAFLIVLAVWEILRLLLGISAEPAGEYMLLLSVPFAVIMIICIWNDAYDPVNIKPGMILFTFMPLAAAGILIMKLKKQTPLMVGKCLTEDAGMLAIYMAWIAVSIVYWIKYAKDKKEEKENWS